MIPGHPRPLAIVDAQIGNEVAKGVPAIGADGFRHREASHRQSRSFFFGVWVGLFSTIVLSGRDIRFGRQFAASDSVVGVERRHEAAQIVDAQLAPKQAANLVLAIGVKFVCGDPTTRPEFCGFLALSEGRRRGFAYAGCRVEEGGQVEPEDQIGTASDAKPLPVRAVTSHDQT